MSVSHSAEVPLLAGRRIDLARIQAPPAHKDADLLLRRTKVVCTLGPACWDIPQLETMLLAGMNVARFNFSHGNHPEHAAVLDRLRHAAGKQQRNVAVMLDTKGPEIRTGFLAGNVKSITLTKGEKLILTTDYHYKGDQHKLACSYASLAKSVSAGQQILVADGTLVLTVLTTDVTAGEVECRIENTCSVGERKNMNLPGVVVDLPTFTEKDVHDIVHWGIKHRVDYIAASFVRKASDVTNLRQLLSENGGQFIKIICKIENLEGLQNYEAILQVTDGIMVARGDLGMEIPPEKVFLAQKYMIREANIAGKPVVTATQMLESMIQNPRPTRAECSDVANAVLDGTDCVMLSGETANGPYFEQAIRVMSRICWEAEYAHNYNALFAAVRTSTIQKFHSFPAGEALASSAVKTAMDINAALIVVLSETGTTARYISKFRPGAAIICLTNNPVVARQAGGLYKGVHAYYVDSLEDDVLLAAATGYEAVLVGIAKPGDLMVIVSGTLYGHGENNQIRVEPIQKPSERNDASTGTVKRLQSFVVADEDEDSSTG